MALGVSTTHLVDTSIPAQDLTLIDGLPAPGDTALDNSGQRATAPVTVVSESVRQASPRPPVTGPATPTPANRGIRTLARQQSSEPSMDAAPPLASASLDGVSLLIPASRANFASNGDLASGGDEPDVPSQADSGDTIPPGSPWNLAADAGKAIGRTSRDKAVVTAGFFTRFGRSVAKSF
jgi:hypothetical protein